MFFFYKTYLSQGRKPSGILLFHSVSSSFPSLTRDVLLNEKEQIGIKIEKICDGMLFSTFHPFQKVVKEPLGVCWAGGGFGVKLD